MTIYNERRTTEPTNLTARINDLEAKIRYLSISPAFGCLTRPALNLLLLSMDTSDLYACYFDIDHMGEHNKVHGKPRLNAIITHVIKPRHNDIVAEGRSPMVVAQWFSGDEFVGIFARHDALGYAQRCQRGFHRYQMSATFVLTPLNYQPSAIASIEYADDTATVAKRHNRRNCIIRLGE